MNWVSLTANPTIDWDTVFSWIPQAENMSNCIQDPIFHAEGSVAEHTIRVTEHLISQASYQSLPNDRKLTLLISAILHDVAKPATREEYYDDSLKRIRVSHNGHANMGARDAWMILLRAKVPLKIRLDVFSLISWHQKVFHILDTPDPLPNLARFSSIGKWEDLILLARSDNAGRISPNTLSVSENLDLLEILCRENEVYDQEFAYHNDYTRTSLIRKNIDSVFQKVYPPSGSDVIIMSAPPGSGKDSYINRYLNHLPSISMDDIRRQLKLSHNDNQGIVIQNALELAKEYLRRKEPFVWNATNTSRLLRDKITRICLDYDARVSIHALDCPYDTILTRNKNRTHAVPSSSMDNIFLKWEPPLRGEAHAVKWINAVDYSCINFPNVGLNNSDSNFQMVPK